MTAEELFALPPDSTRVDKWLFSGRILERYNRNRFHSPGHSSAVTSMSTLLGMWSKIAGAGRFRAYGYGCPYLLGRGPDTVLSFDASLARQPTVIRRDSVFVPGVPLLAVEVLELDEDQGLVDQLVQESLRLGVPAASSFPFR